MVTYRPGTKFNQMFNPLTETFTIINRNKRERKSFICYSNFKQR